jgi:hypothetical protein
MTVTVRLPATEAISIDAMARWTPWSGAAGSATTTALRPPGPRRAPRASSTYHGSITRLAESTRGDIVVAGGRPWMESAG